MGVKALTRTVVRSRDPMIRRFYPLALTEWLPTERVLMKTKRSGIRGDGCKRCGAWRETNRHVFTCDSRATRLIRSTLYIFHALSGASES